MGRRTLHLLMAMALLLCIASMINSLLSPAVGIRCPLCGGVAARDGVIYTQVGGQEVWRELTRYSCRKCDFVAAIANGRRWSEHPPNSGLRDVELTERHVNSPAASPGDRSE